MHPTALLELVAELVANVLKLDAPADAAVSAFFRQHRDLGPRNASLAETVYAVLRERLLCSTWRSQAPGPMPRRPGHPRVAGSELFAQCAVTPAEERRGSTSPGIDSPALAPKAAPQPARLAGHAAAARLGTTILALARRSTRPRRWTCASTPSRPNAEAARLSWPQPASRQCPHAVLALGPAGGWQAGAQQAGRVHLRRRGSAGRGSQLLVALLAPSAARWWRTLRRGRRQDARQRRHAQHRAALRLRRVGPPARRP